MPYYNLTNVTNSSNPLEMTIAVNELAGGWVGPSLLITIFMILFISMKEYPRKEAFASASFISTAIALLFYMIGFVDEYALFLTVLMTTISIVALIMDKS